MKTFPHRLLILIVGFVLWVSAATSVFAFNYGDRVESTIDGLNIHSSDYLSSSVIDHANTGDVGTVEGGPYYDSASGYYFYYVVWATHSAGYSVQNYLSQPDLTKSSDGLNNLSPHVGDTVTASLVIQNQSCSGGNVVAGAFHVGWYFSTTTSFSGVSPFYETPLGGCPAGGTVSPNQNITISAGTAPGTYYLGYKIDDENEVGECNENNNGIFYWTITVLPPPQPDLAKYSDSLNNTSPHGGDTVTASITIQNESCSGGSTNAGAFHVGWYWSTSSSFFGASPFYETSVSGCAANSTVSLNQNVAIDPSTTSGTYYLGYKIDDENEVNECNENNNGIFYWAVSVAGLADLTSQNITVNPNPASVGSSVNVNYTVANIGGTAAPPSHTKVQIKNSSNVLLTQQTFLTAGIAANSSTSESRTMSLVGASPGTYYAYVIVDNNSEVSQSNTNNDLSSGTAFTVQALGGGSWTQLVNPAPGPVNLMLLLSDGTVMAAKNDDSSTFYSNWYRLTPDIHGSYVNGTWTFLPSMNYTRLFYSSQMLTNSQVLVAGGEYGTGAATSEIYDPLANTWTQVSVPISLLNPANSSPNTGRAQGFIDSESKLLPNGNVLVAPIGPSISNGTLIYNPAIGTWSSGPATLHWLAEAGWVKLPDNSFLTADPDSTSSERYIPALNQWINDATVPTTLYASLSGYVGETGPAFLLPNGTAFFIGGTGHTALYTPSGSTAPGIWSSGPDIPNGLVAADAPGAMMSNGKVLCAAAPAPYISSGNPVFPSPTSFFEYDPVANSFVQVSAPIGQSDNVSSFQTLMLNLPDGSVLYSHFGSDLYVYQPVGSQLAAGKPTVSSITQNADGSFHLAGTLLNGISQGAAYGDDEQMDENYPLVRVTNSIGNVYYERTYNWNSTGVMTGNTPETTEFANTAALSPGTYSLVAVANGISSDPFSFTVPLPKSNQTISFGPLANKTYGEPPFGVSATASSGLSVGFSILSGPATLSGNNVTLTGTGTVTVRASQSGNSSFNAAPNVDQPFIVYAPPQASVALSGNNFAISWPTNVAGFVLQSTPSLNPASWSTVSPSPVIVNGQFTVTNNAASGNMFYRLQK